MPDEECRVADSIGYAALHIWQDVLEMAFPCPDGADYVRRIDFLGDAEEIARTDPWERDAGEARDPDAARKPAQDREEPKENVSRLYLPVGERVEHHCLLC
jgi:hypothetical protein